MTLTYGGGKDGKTTARTDSVRNHVIARTPDRIAAVAAFETADPRFQGEMAITTRLRAAGDGTEVVMAFENIPPGIAPEDNDLGTRMAPERPARPVEAE